MRAHEHEGRGGERHADRQREHEPDGRQQAQPAARASLSGQTPERESVRGRPARFDVMEEIARLTRGAVLAEPSMAEVAQRVRELPPPEPLVSRMRLWAHPALGAIVVALMTLFRIGRKLAGRV